MEQSKHVLRLASLQPTKEMSTAKRTVLPMPFHSKILPLTCGLLSCTYPPIISWQTRTLGSLLRLRGLRATLATLKESLPRFQDNSCTRKQGLGNQVVRQTSRDTRLGASADTVLAMAVQACEQCSRAL